VPEEALEDPQEGLRACQDFSVSQWYAYVRGARRRVWNRSSPELQV
jgi:hypothetical protein